MIMMAYPSGYATYHISVSDNQKINDNCLKICKIVNGKKEKKEKRKATN